MAARQESSPGLKPATSQDLKDTTLVKLGRPKAMTTADKLGSTLKWTYNDFETGRWRKLLYRFLTDNVPVINACVWTWVRLAAAPGEYRVIANDDGSPTERAKTRLDRLASRFFTNPSGNRIGVDSLLPELFTSLYRDGIFAGFLTVNPN